LRIFPWSPRAKFKKLRDLAKSASFSRRKVPSKSIFREISRFLKKNLPIVEKSTYWVLLRTKSIRFPIQNQEKIDLEKIDFLKIGKIDLSIFRKILDFALKLELRAT